MDTFPKRANYVALESSYRKDCCNKVPKILKCRFDVELDICKPQPPPVKILSEHAVAAEAIPKRDMPPQRQRAATTGRMIQKPKPILRRPRIRSSQDPL